MNNVKHQLLKSYYYDSDIQTYIRQNNSTSVTEEEVSTIKLNYHMALGIKDNLRHCLWIKNDFN